MGYNFPNDAVAGDVYEPVSGPSWRYDGLVWKQIVTEAVEEAPIDDKPYARQNAAWLEIPPPGVVDWDNVNDKPETFPPTVPIAQSDVTNLVTDLAGKAPTAHTHVTSDVTGLDAALAGKAPAVHTHATSDVTGLDTALAGKAPTVHTHASSDVFGLDAAQAAQDAAIAGKADAAATTTALDGKVNDTGDVMTGALGLPIGTVGLPGLYFPAAADATGNDTGIYCTGALIGFTYNGTARLWATANGAAVSGTFSMSGALSASTSLAVPAGGATAAAIKVSSTANFGVFFGSGVPTVSAAKGSIYLRSDGASGSYTYVNTNGTTGWEALADSTALAGKAATVHTHATADITGLDAAQAAQDTAISGKAATVHTHAQADVTNLTADLALKAPLVDPAFTGKVVAGGITATTAGFNITPGVGSPSSLVDGDFWLTTANFLYRIGGASHFVANLGGTQTFTAAKNFNLATRFMAGTATPAGGATTANINFGTAQIGIYFGSGVPTVTAVQGSLYLRTDGTGTNTRVYVNTNGTTGWAAMSVVAVGTSAPSSPATGDVWIDTT